MNLIQIADSLFSKYARVSRANAAGQVDCICCGGTDHWSTFDPAHFVSRACMALRWELTNVWPCHRICHEDPQHLANYKASLIQKKGEAFVEDLVVRSKKFQKAPNEEEIKEIIEDLTRKLQEYGSE